MLRKQASPLTMMILAVDGPIGGAVVHRAVLHDVAVVHGAEVDPHGQVVPTFVHCPGSRVEAPVCQAERPSHAEAVTPVSSHPIYVEIDRGREILALAAFVAATAAPMLDGRGSPLRLAELPSSGCPYPAISRLTARELLLRPGKAAPAAERRPAGAEEAA